MLGIPAALHVPMTAGMRPSKHRRRSRKRERLELTRSTPGTRAPADGPGVWSNTSPSSTTQAMTGAGGPAPQQLQRVAVGAMDVAGEVGRVLLLLGEVGRVGRLDGEHAALHLQRSQRLDVGGADGDCCAGLQVRDRGRVVAVEQQAHVRRGRCSVTVRPHARPPCGRPSGHTLPTSSEQPPCRKRIVESSNTSLTSLSCGSQPKLVIS